MTFRRNTRDPENLLSEFYDQKPPCRLFRLRQDQNSSCRNCIMLGQTFWEHMSNWKLFGLDYPLDENNIDSRIRWLKKRGHPFGENRTNQSREEKEHMFNLPLEKWRRGVNCLAEDETSRNIFQIHRYSALSPSTWICA